ncbi:MAG: DUF349 domain-containing protein, partial [Bacteroidetes bacterium]|nr:DUF349 domain-containing protein [Bacteroidota bacterium]
EAEPETPVLEEVVVAEAEPETPVLEEAVAAEPEPEAPAVEEVVVAEAEPETPVLEEVVVAEAEPEAPAVEEVVVAEAEPETPVLEEVVVAEAEPEPEMTVEEETVTPEAVPDEITVVEPVAESITGEPRIEEVTVAEKKKISEIKDQLKVMDTVVHDEEEEVLQHHEIAALAEDIDIESREQLVERLEAVVEAENLEAVKTQVSLVKVAFLKRSKDDRQAKLDKFIEEGGTKETYVQEEDSLDIRFREAFNIYKTRKNKYNEELEIEKTKNLEEKKQILEELKVLINSEETLKKTYDEFKTLQEKWKLIGMVPKADANNLWQNYHFLVEKFFDKVKINKELKDLDLRKNLELKIAICEKAEALILEPSILKSFKYLQQYHEEWKEIGPVPQDKKDEIWNRFKDATDKINERRRDYYEQVRDEQENNLMAKNALVDQAEKILSQEIITSKQWQETTDQLTELQKLWRTIGPAPKINNDAIWAKFKNLVDTYFTNKKEFFNDIKEEQLHNYNLKLDLCVQAEALKTSTDWKKTTQELIRMQEDWKKIGPIPRKYSDKIWKRFRAACDEFFTHKSSFFSNIQSTEAENLRKKEELIKRVEEYEFAENKKQNLEILNGFQRDWMEIGFVPIKDKERLQNEFRKVINLQMDKLKISSTEMSAMAYRNRYESMPKESPDAIKNIARERTFLAQKISRLQEEINLWENNIGFLAQSQKANLLKEEFEKKINKAKEEMKLMELKLKMLRES